MITLGFGFDEVDREKLHESFGWSMEEFSNFLDVQALAAKCGYPADSSLSTLAQKILGVKMHVEPSFTETDWEEERLRSSESFFASMSVLAIGQIYRQLRHWHALPKRCSTCRQELGRASNPHLSLRLHVLHLGIFYDRHMQCVDKSCNETFKRIDRHLKHCLESGHPYHNQLCWGCHRILPAEEQIKLDASQTKALEIQEVPFAHSVSREVLQNAQNRREAVLKGQYRQSLIACRQDLTHYLYSDLKEVTVH